MSSNVSAVPRDMRDARFGAGDVPGREERARGGGADAARGRGEPLGRGQEALDAAALRRVEGPPA